MLSNMIFCGLRPDQAPSLINAEQRRERAASIVAALVAARLNLCPQALRGPVQGPRALARGRRIAIYLAHVAAGLPVTAAGAGFARSRASAIDACRRVENARDDDKALDLTLDQLAEAIGAALAR